MARYFLDSSALVKRYHRESGSEIVEAFFDQPGNNLVVSRLALFELHSTFARLVRENVLTKSDFDAIISRIESDIATGVFTVAAVSSQRLDAASSVLRTFGLENPIRTLDAIHLATASALHRRRPLAAFIAADNRLLASASACGLAVTDVG